MEAISQLHADLKRGGKVFIGKTVGGGFVRKSGDLGFFLSEQRFTRREMLIKTVNTTQTNDATKVVDMTETEITTETLETCGMVKGKRDEMDETKIDKCVEDSDFSTAIGHLEDQNKCGKVTNFGNNGERRNIRWEKTVGSKRKDQGEIDVTSEREDLDETKIDKCVEDTDIGQAIGHLKGQNKCVKSANIGNNRERRNVRWENQVGNNQDGYSSGSSKLGQKIQILKIPSHRPEPPPSHL